jgi:alkylhydroperoxidase family enzyme
MPRIEPLSPPYADDVQASFDAIMPPGAAPLVLFRTMATSARAWSRFRAGSLLDKGPLTLRQREILIDRTCARAGCEYEWGVHVAIFAERAKLSPEQVAATVLAGPDAACWSEEDAALVRLADALHERASLSGAEWAALRGRFSEAEIVEALMVCGFYRTVSYLANGLDLPLEPDAARFPAC